MTPSRARPPHEPHPFGPPPIEPLPRPDQLQRELVTRALRPMQGPTFK